MGQIVKINHQSIIFWSRIFNCNFSTAATSAAVRLSQDLLPPRNVQIWDNLRRRNSKQDLNLTRCNYKPNINNNCASVPFAFPPSLSIGHKSSVVHSTSANQNPKLDEKTVHSQPNASPSQEKDTNRNPGKPNAEQLEKVYLQLSDDLPQFFVKTQDYRVYDPQMVFEDNINHVIITGASNYVTHLSMIKIKARIKYSRVRLTVLKATQHPEEGTVKVRWRIVGSPGFMKVFLSFWKLNFVSGWTSKKESEWIDGFSIFTVNDKGLVIHHVCDKMMPDDDKEVVDPKKAKIANIAAL